MPLGMMGALFYFSHTIIGNLLWSEYNPITTDISSLTATGAPHVVLLRILSLVYGVCMLLMIIGLLSRSLTLNQHLRIGYLLLLIMQITSLVGYSLFPLSGDKTEMNFQNTMHIIITILVVFTVIPALFFMASGYLKEEETKKLGKFTLIMAILITIFGMLNPISMQLKLNILGLTERLVIYNLQILMFIISYYNTFIDPQRL
jgi:predicted membrane channel-forming protein YqfA (hemolysin III family)